MKPTEAPHQKQRVKILAAILNSFHFNSAQGEAKSKLIFDHRFMYNMSTTPLTYYM